jgi:subtilisin family serine protease
MNRITFTRFAVAAAVIAGIVGTSAATSAVQRPKVTASSVHAAPRGHLMAYGGRSPAQQRSGVGAKFDAQLADLARHASRARAGQAGLMDLHSMNPAAHFIVSRQTGVQYVAVDAVTRGDAQQLKAALTGLGLQHPTVFLNDVGGWLPVTALNAAAGLPQLHSIRASMSRAHSGAVTSQGDYVQGSAAARTASNVDGTGVTVGILSDSYDCYALYAQSGSGVPASGNNGYASNGFSATAADDITSLDLPAANNINVLEEASTSTDSTGTTCGFSPEFLPNGDEGRAMMQIVHDVAPGAKLAFHTAAITEADFAQGIQDLATAGAKVIADDVSYFDEPFFQDGLVAQSVDMVNAAGVAYFSAAGNSGTNGYDNTAPAFPTASTSPAGEQLLNFNTSGGAVTNTLAVDIPQLVPGEYIAVILEWDQPYVTGTQPGDNSPGASSQMDLCITGSASGLIGAPQNPSDPNGGTLTNIDNQTQICTGTNGVGSDPYQILFFGFPANAADTDGVACPSGVNATVCSAEQVITVQVGLKSGGTAPHRIKVAIDDNGAGVTYPGPIVPSGGTLQGHPSATGAMAIGAAFWDDTTVCGNTNALESFSAKGGDPILFTSTGAAQTAEYRQKPDIVGPDGGSNTFLGFQITAGGSGQCSDTGLWPDFFGTSAATPHVAATAALMLQKNPALTPTQIYTALRSTTSPMTGTSTAPDYLSGYGFIRADAALASISAGGGGAVSVTLDLTPTTINVGQSATLAWTIANATSCTASGDWPTNGAIAPTNGSLMVTPASAGSYTYTIACTAGSGNSGSSASGQQVLTVITPSSGGGGGGGALDLTALLLLTGIALTRARRTGVRQA